MIWSSRARNKSCSPPSRCSRGRIRSSAPASAEHRIRAFDSRESQFPFCQELTPTAAIPGKFQRRNSPTSTRQTALSRVFHSRLFQNHYVAKNGGRSEIRFVTDGGL